MKIETGQIKFIHEMWMALPEFEGILEKIILVNNKQDLNHIGTFLKVSTEEGETIIHKQIDNKSGIFYPININAASEFLDVKAGRPANVNLSDINQKFYVDGYLVIEIYNAGEKGQIENIIAVYQCGNKKILDAIQSISNKITEMDKKHEEEKLRTRLLGVSDVISSAKTGRNKGR